MLPFVCLGRLLEERGMWAEAEESGVEPLRYLGAEHSDQGSSTCKGPEVGTSWCVGGATGLGNAEMDCVWRSKGGTIQAS